MASLIYIWMSSLRVCMCTKCMSGTLEVRRRHQMPWNWGGYLPPFYCNVVNHYKWLLLATVYALGTEPWSSEKVLTPFKSLRHFSRPGLYIFFLFLFFGAGDRIPGLVLARQALYHWAKSPTPYIFKKYESSRLKGTGDPMCFALEGIRDAWIGVWHCRQNVCARARVFVCVCVCGVCVVCVCVCGDCVSVCVVSVCGECLCVCVECVCVVSMYVYVWSVCVWCVCICDMCVYVWWVCLYIWCVCMVSVCVCVVCLCVILCVWLCGVCVCGEYVCVCVECVCVGCVYMWCVCVCGECVCVWWVCVCVWWVCVCVCMVSVCVCICVYLLSLVL